MSALGCVVEREMETVASRLAGVIVDRFVVMPDHVHLLLEMSGGVGVGDVVGQIKSRTTKQARRQNLWGPAPLWQPRFHDRIVRTEREREAIRRYIASNPYR